jgi:molecular chaperone GrpE
MEEFAKEKLVEQFRAYLTENPLDASALQNQTDLFSLFTELSAVRHEVKLESRQFKAALEDFKIVFDSLQSTQENIVRGLNHSRDTQHDQQHETLRVLLIAFLEIFDRLEAAMNALNNYTPSGWAWLCHSETRFIQGLREGHAITLRRLEQMLSRYQVRTIPVLQKPFDPHLMQAVEVDNQSEVDNGIVTAELRKGFMWENDVLRIAEVKVNKQTVSTSTVSTTED